MLSKEASNSALVRLFRRHSIVDLEMLLTTLETNSRMSAFRRLKEVGYLSSFTHAGKYYTLHNIPQFDRHGLWFYDCAGFSRAGTLKDTVVHLVRDSDAGRTHKELEGLLRVRVHNALLDLTRQKRIGRERLEGRYLYVDSDPDRAALQVHERQELESASEPLPVPLVIEVLVEALQATGVALEADAVAGRLRTRGVAITTDRVLEVFTRYGMVCEKKTPPPSPRSRP